MVNPVSLARGIKIRQAIAGMILPGLRAGQYVRSQREIARELGISVQTVSPHVARVLREAGVTVRREAGGRYGGGGLIVVAMPDLSVEHCARPGRFR